MDTLNFLLLKSMNAFTKFFPSLIYCIIIIIVGLIFLRILSKIAKKALVKTNKFSDKIINLIIGLIKAFIYTIITIIVFDKFGINLTSIAAIFSALSIAFTLAAKDTLSNLAKGFQIYITHPFKPGDYIEIGSVCGTVKDIQIFYTRLISDDNKTILIPNKMAADDKIINYSLETSRAIDFECSIPSKNLSFAKEILNKYIENNDLIINSKGNSILVSSFDSETVKLSIHVFASRDNYKNLKLHLIEDIQTLFAKNNIFLN